MICFDQGVRHQYGQIPLMPISHRGRLDLASAYSAGRQRPDFAGWIVFPVKRTGESASIREEVVMRLHVGPVPKAGRRLELPGMLPGKFSGELISR